MKGPRHNVMSEKRKYRKCSQNSYQAGGYGCDGTGLRDNEPRPGVKKTAEWAVSVAHIDVLPSGIGCDEAPGRRGVRLCARRLRPTRRFSLRLDVVRSREARFLRNPNHPSVQNLGTLSPFFV